jgi:hypothetical protein
MKKMPFFSVLIIFFLLNQLSAGVIKESKSSVSFGGFGKFITHTKAKIDGLQKREDTQKDFKGEGFMGSLMSQMFAKTGNTGEITKLQEMKIYHTKSEECSFGICNPLYDILRELYYKIRCNILDW